VSFARRECELCVFAAASEAELLAQLQQVQAYIKSNPGVALLDLAATLAARDSADKPVRLAVLAGDVAELAKKLQQAAKKIAEAKSPRWMTRTGLVFSSQPLQGKLAFLFPGEGSQYLNMLADLAQQFPEVREWFDFWQGLYDEQPARPVPTSCSRRPASWMTSCASAWRRAVRHGRGLRGGVRRQPGSVQPARRPGRGAGCHARPQHRRVLGPGGQRRHRLRQ